MFNNFLRVNFRFLPFMEAEGGGGGSTSGSGNEGSSSSEGGNSSSEEGGKEEGNEPSGKSFSQEDVNRLIANAKKEAKKAAIKSLGFDDLDIAKTEISQYLEKKEQSKSEIEKKTSALEKKENEMKALMSELEKSQRHLKVVSLGANAKYAADVVTLASNRMTELIDFDKAIELVKTDYPSMFSATGSEGGTGNNTNPARKQGAGSKQTTSLGERLAKKSVSSATPKTSYFSN